MTLYDKLMIWAQNQWPIVVVLVIVVGMIYFRKLLEVFEWVYAKFFSGEKLFKKTRLEFVRIEAYQGNDHWKSSESSRVLTLKSEAEAAGEYSTSLRYPATDFLKKSNVFFELGGRFDSDPNPTMDIILCNNSASPKILLTYGLEVAAARFRVISGGSVSKITLEETERYKIEFPYPKLVKGVNAHDDKTKTVAVPTERYSGEGALVIGDMDSSDPVCFWEWEWAGTPVVSMSPIDNPPRLMPNEPYRFTVEIEKSERMPTDTLLHVLIKTDDGQFRSDALYFLKA